MEVKQLEMAEQRVIGAICVDRNVFSGIIHYCSASDFENDLFRMAFEVATKLDNSGREWDVMVLIDGVCQDGHLPIEMVEPAIKNAMSAAPLSATEVYLAAKAVKNDSAIREIQSLASSIQEDAFHRADPLEIIQKIEAQLEGLKHDAGSIQAPEAAYHEFQRWFADQMNNPGAAFVKTGFSDLDRVLCGGFIKSGLYVFGARPGMGKTTAIINIAERVSLRRNALFISLEMPSHQIFAKRTAIKCRIPYSSIMSGKLTEDEMTAFLNDQQYFERSQFYVVDGNTMTISDIVTAARSVPNLGILFVDYLGLITPADSDAQKPKNEQTAAISAGLKRIAKRLNIPVIVACQLNRESVKSNDKRPGLTDLRDSGAIEQDADGVVLLYRESYFTDEKPDVESIELNVAKNRHGMTGTVRLNWEAKTGIISEYYAE